MVKKITLKEIGDMLTHVVKHMATKDDIEKLATKDDVRGIIREEVPGIVAEELKPLSSELKQIRRDLDGLKDKYENVSGFSKEIDHALERIAKIEKHLGLDKTLAA